jgi:hypothetical protein
MNDERTPRQKAIHRGKRIAAFTIAAGIVAPGAGAWADALGIVSITAVASAVIGAILVSSGLIATLLLIYAAKGEVSDRAFDGAIAEHIENLNSKKSDK